MLFAIRHISFFDCISQEKLLYIYSFCKGEISDSRFSDNRGVSELICIVAEP